jgi:outer membrane receptor protein involved in Fe transport
MPTLNSMASMRRTVPRPLCLALLAFVLSMQVGRLSAQTQATTPAPAPSAQPATNGQATPQKPEEPAKYEETVVVSASRSEEKLINAPATMSVITGDTIQNAPSQNFAELLRTVPGLNVTQVSARDINVTSRGASGTLATGQLALLDGRSLYQDFFGFVMWDFLPVNFNEVKQIEVIRGAASAVWGANALYGVVNVITKSPREMQGTSFVAGFGGFDRGSQPDAGSLWYLSGTHAQAIDARWSYKISAGSYSQDPMARPTGTVPCDRPEVCPSGPRGVYPVFTNQGAAQPKIDGRVDYDYENGAKLSISGGAAGTEGIMHTGIGPFDITSGSVMGYAKANYTKQGFHASFFTNLLNGDADNLLTSDAQGRQIVFNFDTSTYDFEASNVQTFAAKHVVSYGGNLRFNRFQLSIAPDADDREEFGGYVQDEIFLSPMFRWVVGGRVDHFDYLNDFVFAPRTTFMIKPREDQTFRVSYNRAYRSPSVINNFLDLTIAQPINLGLFSPTLSGRIYPLPVSIQGNQDLKEQSLDAFEIGYTGVIGKRATVSAAFYINNSKNEILFTQDKSVLYTAQNPPPGWPLPPIVIAAVPGGSFPARFTYMNFGKSTQRGFEVGVNGPVTADLDAFVNYSWQGTPDPKDFDLSELNIPAKNRFNAGVNFSRGRYLGDLTVSYSGSAFWQDVLDDPFHGTTKAYTLVNGGFGVRWNKNRVTTSLKVVNLANQSVQQHVFGDILKRQIVGEMRVGF